MAFKGFAHAAGAHRFVLGSFFESHVRDALLRMYLSELESEHATPTPCGQTLGCGAMAPKAARKKPAAAARIRKDAGAERMRLYRRKKQAGQLFTRILTEALRLRVIPVLKVEDATDCSRMHALDREVSAIFGQIPKRIIGSLLILDFSARSPELSKAFVEALRDRRESAEMPADAPKLFLDMAREKEWKNFWKGPARLNMKTFLAKADLAVVGDVAELFYSARRLRADKLMQAAAQLPNMGSYLSFGLIRSVCSVVGAKLRGADMASASMSDRNQMVAELVDFETCRKHLNRELGLRAPRELLAYFYCETTKVLRYEGIMKTPAEYGGDAGQLAEDLGGKSALALARQMESMAALSDVEESEEVSTLNRFFPGASDAFHATTATVARWRQLSNGRWTEDAA